MWQHVGTFVAGLFYQPWVVASMGLAVAGLCFMFGRSFFRKPPKGKEDEVKPEDIIPKAVADRRLGTRRRGHCVTVNLIDPQDESSQQGWVVDRSAGGLCIEVDRPVDLETILKVRPNSSAGTTPWTEVVVKSCRTDPGGFHLGLQFIKTPSYNVLMLFG